MQPSRRRLARCRSKCCDQHWLAEDRRIASNAHIFTEDKKKIRTFPNFIFLSRAEAVSKMSKKQKKDVAVDIMDRASQRIFNALASGPRRMILVHLAGTSLTAGEISSRFDMAKPSISQHLAILENAGLIEGDKRGQFIHYSLVPEQLRKSILSFVEHVSPVTHLEKPETTKAADKKPTTSAEKKAKKQEKKASIEAKEKKPGKQEKAASQQMGLLDLFASLD